MPRTNRTFSVGLLAVCAMACAHAQRAPATPDGGAASGPIELKFAWPAGFQTQILTTQQSRWRGSEPTGFIARQRMVTERKGNEIWVASREVVAQGDQPDLESSMKVNEALIQVVSPDGKFRRAEGLDQALSALKPTDAEDRENARRALVRSTAFDWELLVGAWAGQKLSVDATHRKQVRGSVPLLAAVETTLDVEYGLEGRVPCTDEETVRRCVELSYRARLAPGDRQATVERMRRMTGSSGPDRPVPEDVHADLELLLVTEPDTLVPHRISQREHLRIRMRVPDGRVVETEERSEGSDLFTPGEQRPSPQPGSGATKKL